MCAKTALKVLKNGWRVNSNANLADNEEVIRDVYGTFVGKAKGR